jgi:hypothetical protein
MWYDGFMLRYPWMRSASIGQIVSFLENKCSTCRQLVAWWESQANSSIPAHYSVSVRIEAARNQGSARLALARARCDYAVAMEDLHQAKKYYSVR